LARIAILEVELYYHNLYMRTPSAIFLALCVILGGCNSYNTVTLGITSPTNEPIVGATVQASPMYFFNPTDNNYIIIGPYDILEPFPAKGDRGTTDENGRIDLQIVSKSPLELIVLCKSFEPWKGSIAITTQGKVTIKPYKNEDLIHVEVQ